MNLKNNRIKIRYITSDWNFEICSYTYFRTGLFLSRTRTSLIFGLVPRI